MRNIRVDELRAQAVERQPLEIVERKGLGHPDSICDGLMEHISVALSREYRQRFGSVLHFNLDKGLLAAGSVEHRFGGGRVLEPMRLIVGDRASFAADEVHVPIAEIVEAAAREWLRQNLPRIDPDRHLRFQMELRPSSPELAGIFRRQGGPLPANDTSALVGYAPLSPTERLVLETERYLNSRAFKQLFPETGEDVKVMGIRVGDQLNLTVAMPLLEERVEGEAAYFRRKAQVEEALHAYLEARQEEVPLAVSLALNTLDRPGHGIEGVYLSLLGTSAEDADSGQVGRGNRVNGVISLHRPAPAEAAAGKNPVSHVGKIYNVLAHRMAARVYREVGGLQEVYVWLCSQIGAPVDHPQVATAQVILEPGITLDAVRPRVAEIIERELAEIQAFTQELIEGQHTVY